MKFKKITALLMSSILLISSNVHAIDSGDNSYVGDILDLQPHLTEVELIEDAERIAELYDMEVTDVLKTIFEELTADYEKGLEELIEIEELTETLSGNNAVIMGANGGTVAVGNSVMGDFYYTPSQTAYLDHGHVGLYYTSSVIVESVPDDGVRRISAGVRLVDVISLLPRDIILLGGNYLLGKCMHSQYY